MWPSTKAEKVFYYHDPKEEMEAQISKGNTPSDELKL